MPSLIVEHVGKVYAGVISGRVVIGRRPEDQIRVADKTIARIHAWIAAGNDGKYFIADAGSKAGTFVNDQRVVVRQALQFNDTIRVGPLSLRLVDADAPPIGSVPIDLRARPLSPPSPEAGISFNCSCGAPFWVPWAAAGKTGTCRTCGNPVRVPQPTPAIAAAAPLQPAHESSCGICHGMINASEETTNCPACNAQFHIECWTENGGCSVYGCSQVSVLRAVPETTGDLNDAIAGAFTESGTAVPDTAEGSGIPWAYGLLAASVLAAVAGALTFGGTSLLMAAAALLVLFRNKAAQQRKIVFLSIAVSMTGALAGVAVSYYWWMGGIPWLPTR
jgi:hypothetical protein